MDKNRSDHRNPTYFVNGLKERLYKRSFFIAKTPAGTFSGLKSGESGKMGTEHDQAAEKGPPAGGKNQYER
ncbi:hypothetical protein J41TS8_17040 [Bacillus sp. J41TS8]|nr:hypothetical protein J41TS8_17040 [Bacillus sp. J41TS8]